MTGAAARAGGAGRVRMRLAEHAHVLGGVKLSGAAARLAAVLDPAFLAEAGWDPRNRVFDLPAGHRLLGGGSAGSAAARPSR